MKKCQKINLQEPQRNLNATANFVNLKRTSTVLGYQKKESIIFSSKVYDVEYAAGLEVKQ